MKKITRKNLKIPLSTIENELFSMNDKEEIDETDNTKNIRISKKRYIENDNAYMDDIIKEFKELSDHEIALEFENYLNEDSDLYFSKDLISSKNIKEELEIKVKKLEELNFESIDELRKIAIEKFGFLNKKFRRKAWPRLIANRQNYTSNLNSNNKIDDNPTYNASNFDQISKY